MKFYIMVTLASIVSFFTSCSSTKETILYRGQCEGKEIVFSLNDKKQFAGTTSRMEIKIEGIPLLKIHRDDIFIGGGMPYDSTLLNQADYQLFNTAQQDVRPDSASEPVKISRYLLFIDPAKFTKREFDTINQCLNTHIQAMESALHKHYKLVEDHFTYAQKSGVAYGRTDFNYVQLSGVVYGRADDMGQNYYRSADKQIYINITLAGLVTTGEVVDSDHIYDSYLGKAYVLFEGGKTVSNSVLNKLKDYHNGKTGRSLLDDFDIKMPMDSVEHRELIFLKKGHSG